MPNPPLTQVGVVDINGQWRGKASPKFAEEKIQDGMRLPLSVIFVDMWGEDIENLPLVFATGDADGRLRPTGRGPVSLPWRKTPAVLYPMDMYLEDETPFRADPRHALAGILQRYASRGWQVKAATELEFYLLHPDISEIRPAINPKTNLPIDRADVNSLTLLDAFEEFFADLFDGAKEMGIDAEAGMSEAGLGQFEVNLVHTDAMKMADDTLLFKRLVHGTARKHGMAASFMAKPFKDDAGNGLHMHFSVLDENGRNIFDDGTEKGTDLLQNAVAGCLNFLADSTLFFAPHASSYDRFVPGAHAPVGISWAYENRTTAVRIPGGSTKARRIEHRVAGGDINPYLLMTAVLGAAICGIEDCATPPAALVGNAYEQDLPEVHRNWNDAINAVEESVLLPRIMPQDLLDYLVLAKRQEQTKYAELHDVEKVGLYVERV